jgi:hypothetical protein
VVFPHKTTYFEGTAQANRWESKAAFIGNTRATNGKRSLRPPQPYGLMFGLVMEFKSELEAVNGAKELRDWFAYWPSFHDAEVIARGRGFAPLQAPARAIAEPGRLQLRV